MQVQEGRIFIGRFKAESDLLAELTNLCKKENIRLGVFNVIGALTCAKLGYYDQNAKKYTDCASLDKKLEITSCTGNISLLDSEIFVHAHITLADHEGTAYGGHLMPGSKIFAAEYYIKELTGATLERTHDSETGLNLWKA
ncbi:MAG: DNA-binding protein [Candidatus Omnitrophica bacterium]|nr:DNA-binding protein [Candidatus Omnitrophota bacterium]